MFCPFSRGLCDRECVFRAPAVGCELLLAVQAIPTISANLTQMASDLATLTSERITILDGQRETA